MKPYYESGGITIYHGDCRDVLPSLCTVDLVLTDPPYGMAWQSSYRTATPQFERIAGDDTIDTSWMEATFALLREGCAAYVATRWDVYPRWREAIEQHLSIRNCIVWAKESGGIGDLEGNYWNEHEFLIYASKGRHLLNGKRTGNVWRVNSDAPSSYQHPTQKPVALMARAINKSSKSDDLVLDPFMGSGTTLRAAKDLGRRAIGIELEERYCEIAVKRLQQEAFNFEAAS